MGKKNSSKKKSKAKRKSGGRKEGNLKCWPAVKTCGNKRVLCRDSHGMIRKNRAG